MKKHLIIISILTTMPFYCANGTTVSPTPTTCVNQCAVDGFYCTSITYSGCSELACQSCTLTSSTSNGITTTVNKTYTTNCPDLGSCTATCSCTTTGTTYKCASGYYGTATSATTGCTKCPENATCAGGNGSTFTCNSGYTQSGNTCVKITCAAGQYLNGSTCTNCPSPGTSDANNSGAITSCYITGGSDDTGTFEYEPKCYYSSKVITDPKLEIAD